METNTNYLNELTNRLKNNMPSAETIEHLVKENKQILSAAGGAFLTVVGLKFISKTVGFLAFVGGAALLYRAVNSNADVKEFLDKVSASEDAKEKENKNVSPKVFAGPVDL